MLTPLCELEASLLISVLRPRPPSSTTGQQTDNFHIDDSG